MVKHLEALAQIINEVKTASMFKKADLAEQAARVSFDLFCEVVQEIETLKKRNT